MLRSVCEITASVLTCAQKLLVTHPYKSLMTFGGCKLDFMLVVGQSISGGAGKPTEKHLFAMDASKVSPASCLLAALPRYTVSFCLSHDVRLNTRAVQEELFTQRVRDGSTQPD